MTLVGMIEQTPPDHSGGYDLQVDEERVEASTYDEAFAQMVEQVPAGWRLISVRSE